jgi:hypothetical protein
MSNLLVKKYNALIYFVVLHVVVFECSELQNLKITQWTVCYVSFLLYVTVVEIIPHCISD